MNPPSPSTLRILECLDRLGEEESRAITRGDWDHLSGLIERGLALVSQLAKQPDRTAPEVICRAHAIGRRLVQRQGQIEEQRLAIYHELQELGATHQRSQAVQAVYSQA